MRVSISIVPSDAQHQRTREVIVGSEKLDVLRPDQPTGRSASYATLSALRDAGGIRFVRPAEANIKLRARYETLKASAYG